jgi:hypothetical protein
MTSMIDSRARKEILAARRSAMHARLADQKRALMATPAYAAVLAARRRRTRRRLAIAAAILLVLWLLSRCECEEPAAPVVVEVDAGTPAPPPAPKAAKPKPKPPVKLDGNIDGSDRPAMVVDPQPTPPWLDQFRMQVAARSAVLAACFNGVEKPGALRWSALVHAKSGRVTESVVEPVFRGVTLTPDQIECLIAGLSDPPFKLDEPDERAGARRVSLVFEF